jgi:DNA-binding transcriptional LysR family regulator
VDWDDLRYLLAVHRRGSLAAAAKELGVTKATASRRLAALEAALATRLFERKPAGLVLTAAGVAAIETAEDVDAQLAQLADRVGAASDARPRGVVRFTAPPWLAERVIIPALPALAAQHPALELQLVGTNTVLNLAQREADLALRNVKPTQPSLASRKVGRLGGCVYASALYLERRGTPSSRADLAGHDLLVYESLGGMPGFEWLRDEPTGGRIAFRANDPVALLGAATAGLGLAAIPCLLADPEPSLRRVPALGFGYTDLHLVMLESLRTTARVRAVVAFVAELLVRDRAMIEGSP